MTAPVLPLGPYEAWVYGPGRSYDLPTILLDTAGVLSAVAEIEDGIEVNDLPSGWFGGGTSGPAFCIPPLWRPAGGRLSFVPFLMQPRKDSHVKDMTAQQLSDACHRIADHLRLAKGKLRVRMNFPVRAKTMTGALAAIDEPAATAPQRRPKVIVGIIDEGIAFAHRAFRSLDGHTRIDRLWAQAGFPRPAGEVPFGREMTGAQIDAAIARHQGDEPEIYRRAGLLSGSSRIRMALDSATPHGTHILDSLAGNWPEKGEDEVRIIAVDLPATVSWDTSGFGKDMFILAGMHFILNRAAQIAEATGGEPIPVVVNISYGHSGGPHDTTALLPAALDELVRMRRETSPTALVLPSGNDFLVRLQSVLSIEHFTGKNGHRTAELRWMLPPDDRTSTYLEAWFPPGAEMAEIEVTLLDPAGNTAATLVGGAESAVRVHSGGKDVGRLSFDHYRGGRWRLVAAMAPSDTRDDARPRVPAGEWRLRVRLAGASALPTASQIQVTIQRDLSFGIGNTGARQSWFVDPAAPDYGDDGAPVEHDPSDAAAKLRRLGTFNGMASGTTSLAVAGYRGDTHVPRVARYSGAAASPDGASRGTPVIADEAVAVSTRTERGLWAPGVVAAGTWSGSIYAGSGTSSAAPLAARHLAEIFRTQGSKLTPADARHNYADLLGAAAAIYAPPLGDGPHQRQRLGAWALGVPKRR